MENKIKDTRRRLDGIAILIKYIDKSRENSLAITSLELSKMWLGKVLKELGTANPYPESKNPENQKIEPTADIMTEAYGFPDGFSHIQKVKWLRGEIEITENELNKIREQRDSSNNLFTYWSDYYFKTSIEKCIESGMWLGMELGRIRDTENK